jgi:ATP-dependent Lon protease
MKLLLKKNELFMVPLKDLVIFPRMVAPFFVGRRRSIRSVEEAVRIGRPLFLVTQKKTSVEDPGEQDMHTVGTTARILQMLKLADGKIRLLVEGIERASIVRYTETKDAQRVIVRPFREATEVTPRLSALMRAALAQFTRFTEVSRKVAPEPISAVQSAEAPDALVDLIAANLPLKTEVKLEILAIEDAALRLERCAALVAAEIEVLGLEQEITGKVRKRLEKNQKDYFLNEQMKEIQKELGAEGEDPSGAKELEEKLKAKGLDRKSVV